MAVFTLSDVNDTLMSQNRTLKSTDKKIGQLSSNMKTFLEVMKGKKLKAREEAIEGGATPAPKGDGVDAATSGLFGGIGAALAGLTGTLSTITLGLTGTLITSFDETMNDISRTFAAAWLGMGNKLKAFFKMFSGEGIIGIGIVKLIEALRGPAAVFDEVAQRWRNIETGRFMKAPNIIGRAINRIADAFGGAGKTLSGLFGEGTKFGKAMSALKSAFTFAEDSKILKLLQGFGGVLKKIFLPIGLIFTAYDTIKGAIEGYEEEGFVGALTGAVSGLLGSIVGAPLNLIKSITLWIGKKLGILSEEDAAKFDEAFDFEQMIKDFGMAIAKTINKIIDWITNFDVGQAVSDGWEAFKNFVKGDPNADRPNDGTETLEIPGANNGTVGAFGKLFANFGKGTPVVAHGEEAIVPKNSEHGKVLQDYEEKKNTYNFNKPKGSESKAVNTKPKMPTADGVSTKPKMPTAASVMPEGMGGFLGKLMDQSKPMMGFAHQKGKELKAKEDAMRASGASDMDIAQSMMGDMGGMLGSLKNLAPKIDLSQAPKMKSNPIKEALAPNNLGNTFGSIVREAEENKEKRATQSSPAPVIISDNSSKSSSTSNTAMPIISKPYDFDDPFVSGIGRTRGL